MGGGNKTDLSTTIAGAVPVLLLIASRFIPIDPEFQVAVTSLVVMLTSYFIGKPSAETKRLRRMIVDDNVLAKPEMETFDERERQ